MFEAHHPLVWVGLITLILTLLLIDILVVHRRAHAIQMREAATWTAVWVSIATIFGIVVFIWLGTDAGIQYATGYLIELSLSVDNLFVFALILTGLSVPAALQHRVLFWGIIGALVMRGVFIVTGTALLDTFHWMIYVFGALLLFSAARMLRSEEDGGDPSDSRILRWAARVFPFTPHYHGPAFITVENGRRVGTALLAALVLIEASDLMFAIDSVPAILAITQDPFLVFASNAFAVLGLRSMYFVLSGVLDRFHYLRFGLAIILGFVGAKLMTEEIIHLPVRASLVVMAIAVVGSIVASLNWPKETERKVEGRPHWAQD